MVPPSSMKFDSANTHLRRNVCMTLSVLKDWYSHVETLSSYQCLCKNSLAHGCKTHDNTGEPNFTTITGLQATHLFAKGLWIPFKIPRQLLFSLQACPRLPEKNGKLVNYVQRSHKIHLIWILGPSDKTDTNLKLCSKHYLHIFPWTNLAKQVNMWQ